MGFPFRAIIAGLVLAAAPTLRAGALDDLGFTALRALHPELTGAGETVAQPEAAVGSTYQVSPTAVGQPAQLFHYYDSSGVYGTSGTAFNPSLVSGHADSVADHFYGATDGGAPGVASVENFDANYFANNIVINLVTTGTTTTWEPVAIASPIVNQSFVFTETDPTNTAEINLFYDAYAAQFGTLFVSGLNNGSGTVTNAPASMYDGIGVGDSDGVHSGQALIVAPGGATSFATPYVTAAAVVLRQAAGLGDFHALTGTDPTNALVLKVGLLEGATKTTGWTHSSTSPLDATSGAGLLNVNTSFSILAGGQHSHSATNLQTLNATPTSPSFTSPITSLDGWDLSSLTARTTRDAVGHYYFDLNSDTAITLTATLTWDSIANVNADTDLINNFDLILVNAVTHAVVWSSVSTAQNVELIYLTNLPGADYDLQVILRGGSSTPALSDTYAVAWSWQPGSTTPVPESSFVWVIGFAGIAFIVRKRMTDRRRSSQA